MPLDETELILHIGGAKCGSSAIQAFLRQNAQGLRDQGIALPGKALDFTSEVTGEQIWAFEDVATGSAGTEALTERLSELFTTAETRGANRIVLSAENICNHASLAPVLARACGNRSIKVVFYVRRQDDFLISSWQQWHLKVFDTVEAYLADRVGRVGCWNSMITPWADVMGDENIVVRPFVRDRLKNRDVVADFCDVVGVDQNGLSPLAGAANPSFDEALARLAHRVRDVFDGPHDNQFYEVMVRLLGKDALKQGSASSLISLETRRRILARYDDENQALKERFLPDFGDAPLFQAPTSSNVCEISEAKKLSEDMAMLTRCVYALATKCDKAS
ncbi:hypothetical protein N9L47_08945 [Rhodobacteraceae bacterium]|nr:hypothetical protein [Paracoccaceae bacterium]